MQCETSSWSVPELSFRNATRDFIFHLGLSRLKIAKVQTAEAFQTLAAFAGINLHVMIITEKLGEMCFRSLSLEGFDYMCQQVRDSISDLIFKLPLRLPREDGPLQEAVENSMQLGLEILHHMGSSACMQLPPPSPACAAPWACYQLYSRLAKASKDLAVSSHLVQYQLETALLRHHLQRRLALPSFPPNAAGNFRSEDELRTATLGALLESMGPQKLHMVEIGTHLGHVAFDLLSRFPQLRYLGIDPYPGNYDGRQIDVGSGDFGDAMNFFRTRNRLARFGSRARLCRRGSAEVSARATLLRACARWATASLDIVFIDGKHDFKSVEQDLHNWIPRVKPGRVVAGHDYRLGEAQTVVRAVHKYLPQNRTLQLAPDGVWWWLA